jgi:molybdenum cofactor cytidylyltransferase
VRGHAGPTGLLLAAGAGARFGGNKLLAPLPAAVHGVAAGTPVGVASCLHLLAAVPRVVAVVRPGDRALASALRDAGALVIESERAHEGMGASLACGVASDAEADGWIVALGDMPAIAPATVARIVAAWHAHDGIVVPTYGGRDGHPVAFGAAWRDDLVALKGDRGARHVIDTAGGAVHRLAVDDPGVVHDIDRPEDLAAGSSTAKRRQ